MKSHIISLLFLVAVIYAALIAAHPHDWIGLEESSGDGNNSAEEFMNTMVPIWEEEHNWTISEEEHNSTDYSSAELSDEETFLGPRIELDV